VISYGKLNELFGEPEDFGRQGPGLPDGRKLLGEDGAAQGFATIGM